MGDRTGSGLPPRFVPLPAAVVDDWVPALTGSQLKLLLVVARQTLGFRDPATGGRKAEDWLTHRQLMRRTGCASEAVSGAVDALVRAGLVRVRAAGGEAAETPQHRRRAGSRLLYGLGPALLPGADGPRGLPGPPPTSESGHRKPKTTIETGDKRDIPVVFENRSGGRDAGPGPGAAGRHWVWRRSDAQWVRAGDPPGPPP